MFCVEDFHLFFFLSFFSDSSGSESNADFSGGSDELFEPNECESLSSSDVFVDEEVDKRTRKRNRNKNQNRNKSGEQKSINCKQLK